MEIETELAQQIVNNMKEIIKQEINFISTDARIIASTDEKRIGETHEAAIKVLKTKEIVTVDYDGQFKMARKGINIPIYMDTEIVGVIGITGKKEEVEQYAKIIKMMTEILVKENWVRTINYNQRTNYQVMLDNLLLGQKNNDEIIRLSRLLNINLQLSRFVVVGMFNIDQADINNQVEAIFSTIHSRFGSNKNNLFAVNAQSIRLLINSENIDIINQQITLLAEKIYQEYGFEITFGIGKVANSIKSIRESYQNALAACKWALNYSNRLIEQYGHLTLGLLTANISETDINLFIERIIGNLTAKEKTEYAKYMDVYEKNNGSIYRCADELFMHKNTFQYKINKFKKKTGFDIRNLSDFPLISLSFRLLKVHKNL